MSTLADVCTRALMPPLRLDFFDWIERTIHLPFGLSADPGADHVAGLFVENRGHQGGSLREQRQIALSANPRLLPAVTTSNTSGDKATLDDDNSDDANNTRNAPE